MENLIKHIAQAIVDNPEQVLVKKIEGERSIVFELKVAKEDFGKILGKGGRNIESVRTILNAVSAKVKKHYILEIVEEDQSKPSLHKLGKMLSNGHQKRFDEDLSKDLKVGVVKWFNDNKGYGFIVMDNSEEIFVHRSAIKGPNQTLAENDQVTFEVIKTDKGLKAINVTKIGS